jgi:hypothetical protein
VPDPPLLLFISLMGLQMRDMRVWYSVALILTIQDELAFARIRMARIYAGMMWSEDILREDVTVVALAELLLWRAPEAASSCLSGCALFL